MTTLTALPADGYTARWQTWNHDGGDTVQLRWENEGWTATGDVAGANVTYVIRVSATWHVRQFLLFRDLAEPDLWLGTDGSGRWGEINGAHRPDLDGCNDVDLAITPFTHSVPIRRLGLESGESAEVVAATVDVETLGVVPVRHRYHHHGGHRFVHTDVAAGVDTEFDVDEYGLAHDVPGLFRRI